VHDLAFPKNDQCRVFSLCWLLRSSAEKKKIIMVFYPYNFQGAAKWAKSFSGYRHIKQWAKPPSQEVNEQA
jgi:hypothetical protein